MTLPDGVTIGQGQSEMVTQRGYFAPPYISCMLAAACSVLIRTGYQLPLPRSKANTPPGNFVWRLHKAIDPTPSEGTSQAQTQLALRELFADATPPPVLFGALTKREMIAAIRNGAGVRVMVKGSLLPDRLKRQMGTGFMGGHAWYIDRVRRNLGGNLNFHIIDPMFRPASRYTGTWARWSEFERALSRSASGKVIVMIGYRGTARE